MYYVYGFFLLVFLILLIVTVRGGCVRYYPALNACGWAVPFSRCSAL